MESLKHLWNLSKCAKNFFFPKFENILRLQSFFFARRFVGFKNLASEHFSLVNTQFSQNQSGKGKKIRLTGWVRRMKEKKF